MNSISISIRDICPQKVVYQNVVSRMVDHDWSRLFNLMNSHRIWNQPGSPSQNIREKICREILIEYLRFILCKIHLSDFELHEGDFQLATCRLVDDIAWHTHLILPRDYFSFCTSVIGEVIDHNPDTKESPNWDERYQRTLSTYRDLLEIEPTHFWTRDLPTEKTSCEEDEDFEGWDFVRDGNMIKLTEMHGGDLSHEIQVSQVESEIEGEKFSIKTMTGQTYWFSVPDTEMRIWDLKFVFMILNGLPPSQNRLIYDGTQLNNDSEKLVNCGIQDGSVVHSVFKLRGC